MIAPQASIQQRSEILGVSVSAIDMEQAVAAIDRWINGREREYVCVTPLHSIISAVEQPELREIYNASGMTTPDGMSVVWLLRRRGYANVGRVYGPDLMRRVFDESQARGWKHFLYGGTPASLDALETALLCEFPRAEIVGRHAPPFRPLTRDESALVEKAINASGADIVWVGIGSPRQELWMREQRGKLDAPVLVGVGAAFDFISGAKRQAPRWVQRSGLEWLFRLASEPRRLWGRYAKYPRYVVRLVLSGEARRAANRAAAGGSF